MDFQQSPSRPSARRGDVLKILLAPIISPRFGGGRGKTHSRTNTTFTCYIRTMPPSSAIIIGSGIAGLACAARLAAKGMHVTVVEKNNYPGGKLGLLEQDGYRFDRGPSLFTQPHLLEELFRDCGKLLSDYFVYEKLEDGTHYFWEDGIRLTAFPDRQLLAAEIQQQLQLAPEKVFQYLNRAEVLYRHIGTVFLNEPIHKLRTWLSPRILTALRHLRLPYLTKSLHNYNCKTLQHAKLVQLFDRFATYNGSDPYQCPAMLSTIAHLELNEGAFYAKGGMISIPEAVYRLCLDLGVKFLFDTEVLEIVSKKGKVKGIKTGKGFLSSSLVVSNSDVYYTYQNLLHDTKRAKHWQQQERSSSGVVFYWGIRKSFPLLGLHNIFFAEDYRAEFDALFKTKTLYPDPTIYVNITSKMEPGHAPDGCENWFVLVNAPAGVTPSSEWMAAMRRNVLEKLSRMLGTPIGPLIATEATLSPSAIDSWTNSYLGALYGTASNTPMAAFARHSNESRHYKGLFFAGGTVHPGGGIPLCLRSGKLAADGVIAEKSRAKGFYI